MHAVVNGTRYTLKTLSELEKVKSANNPPAKTKAQVIDPTASTNDERSSNNDHQKSQHTTASDEYIQLLEEKNKTVYLPPRPRGFPSMNGRGRGVMLRYTHSHKRRFQPHPDFYPSNTHGTYYG